jgi:hypothetical protein
MTSTTRTSSSISARSRNWPAALCRIALATASAAME